MSNTPTQAGLTGVLVQRNKLRVFFGLAGTKPTVGGSCYKCFFFGFIIFDEYSSHGLGAIYYNENWV